MSAVAMTHSSIASDEGALINHAPYVVALFVDPVTGRRVRERITSALSHLPFESAVPIRSFPAYRGRRAHQGRYWFSGSRSRVNFESLFEKTALRVLDFRGDIARVSSNPFWLLWPKDVGPKRHAPDFFARRTNGSVLVVDVKPEGRMTETDRIQQSLTRDVCTQLGWEYEQFTTIDPTIDRNLRLLGGYSRPQYAFDSSAAQVAINAVSSTARGRMSLADLLDLICCDLGIDDAAGLCGIYHMIWCGQLHVDLAYPLAWSSELHR
ncbi:hypothetical protein BKG85_04775 [Mycobacteroides chelonae]|nr:hypothetical protein BKG85_04775 [Mycobacteroides chelonae]